MGRPSLDKILEGFSPGEENEQATSGKRPVTIWIPTDYKARYDRLQQTSSRKFGKKLRELIQAAIDLTENKAS